METPPPLSIPPMHPQRGKELGGWGRDGPCCVASPFQGHSLLPVAPKSPTA